VSRRNRDRTEGAGDGTDPLADGARADEPGAVDDAADAIGPAVCWRDLGENRDIDAWVTTVARRSNARAKLMAT
jgi:hypothetical protein